MSPDIGHTGATILTFIQPLVMKAAQTLLCMIMRGMRLNRPLQCVSMHNLGSPYDTGSVSGHHAFKTTRTPTNPAFGWDASLLSTVPIVCCITGALWPDVFSEDSALCFLWRWQCASRQPSSHTSSSNDTDRNLGHDLSCKILQPVHVSPSMNR